MYIDLEKFQKAYYEQVKPLEDELESEKSSIRTKVAIIIVVTVIIEIYLFANMHAQAGGSNLFAYIILGTILICTTTIGKFVGRVKKTIFPQLFRSIDSNLIYDGTQKISYDKFADSELFTSYGRYSCQDSLSAVVNGNTVGMCELQVETGSGKNRRTVFSGLFIHIRLNTSIKSNIKIVNNTTKDFGFFKTLFANSNKVNLENVEFEEKYDVYSEDQIYARKIITLTFMEKLLFATQKLDRKLHISFKNNNIYIAVSGIQLINDKAIFAKKIDMLNIAKEIDNILCIIDTLNYLDLSEKI